MKYTYREIISNIQETLNSTTKDTYIPRRLILSLLKQNIQDFMTKKLNDKSLFREVNIYDWIECIEMVSLDTIKCPIVELQRCNSLMKSKNKLPNLIWSRFGASIVSVTTVDSDREFNIISEKDYSNLKRRRGFEKFKGNYVIIGSDNHLYIPDSTIELVNALVYTLDESKYDCSSCKDNDCRSYWDNEISIPDKILNPSIASTINNLMIRIQIPKDENPNLDSNIKSQTV